MPPFARFAVAVATTVTLATALYAATNSMKLSTSASEICIVSNSIPNHSTGQFPNKGNPNTIREQTISACLPLEPTKSDTPQPGRTVGILENGVVIRPGTADYYDASSPRGHSRDASSGWNLDGMGAREMLGLDDNNAHVDHTGIYHYHGVPEPVVQTSEDTRIGWAADGFEIHYVGDDARPSYMLKGGTRPTEPGGAYDGTYNEDFEFIAGAGNLDQCNGATMDGTYVYFATDAYPYFPRCLWGTKIANFR
ncbi:YHYH protein [Planktotalea sp.]|uniref:YHYH protein n=1 Tax=Planktotalea sp. TaxID=2029877 RepID=UPI003298E795